MRDVDKKKCAQIASELTTEFRLGLQKRLGDNPDPREVYVIIAAYLVGPLAGLMGAGFLTDRTPEQVFEEIETLKTAAVVQGLDALMRIKNNMTKKVPEPAPGDERQQ